MDWLNYHHLYYFWNVVKEGTVSAAAETLQLARPTVTAQIRELEKSVGEPLFERKGRNLRVTNYGQQVFDYADEIFAIGAELQEFLRTGKSGHRSRFTIGMPDVVPKLIAFELLKPALHLADPPQIVCYEGTLDSLLADLALHRVDLILSDSPAPTTAAIEVYSHKLGECGMTLMAAPSLAEKYEPGFPQSLDGAPVLFPTHQTAVRRALTRWFDEQEIRPRIIAEFQDSALLKVFGQSGEGVFPVPAAIENEVQRQYGVQVVGRLESVRDSFYAISAEKRVQHAAAVAIMQQARSEIFESD